MENNSSPDEQLIAPKDFHKEHYYKKVDYLKDHFSRTWTRFNFFLSVETALIGGKVFIQNERKVDIQFHWQFALIGLIVSVVWYVMGAQDKYLISLYRKEVEQEFERLEEYLSPACRKEKNNYVGQTDEVTGIEVNRGIFQWRKKAISSTTLAAIIPFMLIIGWTIILLAY